MPTTKRDTAEPADLEDDPTLGGALPDPADQSLHGRLQSRQIGLREYVNEATAPPVAPEDPPA